MILSCKDLKNTVPEIKNFHIWSHRNEPGSLIVTSICLTRKITNEYSGMNGWVMKSATVKRYVRLRSRYGKVRSISSRGLHSPPYNCSHLNGKLIVQLSSWQRQWYLRNAFRETLDCATNVIYDTCSRLLRADPWMERRTWRPSVEYQLL